MQKSGLQDELDGASQQQRTEKGCGLLLTVRSFLLAVELFYLQLTILAFSYSWGFFA